MRIRNENRLIQESVSTTTKALANDLRIDVTKTTNLSQKSLWLGTKRHIAVLMGDPRLTDKLKKDRKFNREDFEVIKKLKKTLKKNRKLSI